LSLATFSDLRDNAGMPPDLMALFLLAGALSAVTIATIMYVGFSGPETRFTLVVTLLLVYALLTLAPLVFLPLRPIYPSTSEYPAAAVSFLL
jgi:hypothetical protein